LTAFVKLLPTSRGFLSGSWERCEVGLSGHALYEECVQTETAGDNDWKPLLRIGKFGNARQKGSSAKKVCCYKFDFHARIVMRICLLAFFLSCLVAASSILVDRSAKFEFDLHFKLLNHIFESHSGFSGTSGRIKRAIWADASSARRRV
jgi:hypothetical protein